MSRVAIVTGAGRGIGRAIVDALAEAGFVVAAVSREAEPEDRGGFDGKGAYYSFDVSASTNVSRAALSFPAPRRHEDGYGGWAGYDHPVSLPVVFTLAAPGSPAVIDANVFLGMCETICIPVQATLKLDPAAAPDDASDTALVKAGFSALPAEAKAGFGAKALPGTHETLVVEATAPGKPSAVDLFVAGENGYMFGPPSREESGDRITFRIPVLDRPAGPPTGAGLPYTLTGETGAVQGLLPYP